MRINHIATLGLTFQLEQFHCLIIRQCSKFIIFQVRLPNSSMMAPHSIDIANMVALHRSNPSSTASENGKNSNTFSCTM